MCPMSSLCGIEDLAQRLYTLGKHSYQLALSPDQPQFLL